MIMDEFAYDLDTMELWELRDVQWKLHREIMRRYSNNLPRQDFIMAYNEIETEIFIRQDKEDKEYNS
jgi:hypothetical protein